MTFTIRDIPTTMRTNNWDVGAQLMERWFSKPGLKMAKDNDGHPPKTWRDVDYGIVKMDWALGFERVARVHRALLSTWSNRDRLQAAKRELKPKIRAWSGQPVDGRPFRFGTLTASTPIVDATSQANYNMVSSPLMGPIDEFFSAIGNAQMRLAVSGIVSRGARGKQVLVVDKVGTYLYDTYDFTDDGEPEIRVNPMSQFLGSWNARSVIGIPTPSRIPIALGEASGTFDSGSFSGATGPLLARALIPNVLQIADKIAGEHFYVDNDSFDQYRARFGRGGDFVVLSDVRVERLTHCVPIEFD